MYFFSNLLKKFPHTVNEFGYTNLEMSDQQKIPCRISEFRSIWIPTEYMAPYVPTTLTFLRFCSNGRKASWLWDIHAWFSKELEKLYFLPSDLVLVLFREPKNSLMGLYRIALYTGDIRFVRRLEVFTPTSHICRNLNHIVPCAQSQIGLCAKVFLYSG